MRLIRTADRVHLFVLHVGVGKLILIHQWRSRVSCLALVSLRNELRETYDLSGKNSFPIVEAARAESGVPRRKNAAERGRSRREKERARGGGGEGEI